jgi:hypothetical protein
MRSSSLPALLKRETVLDTDLPHAAAADIVIGIPGGSHLVPVAQAGLAKYFPQFTAHIVDSEATLRALLSAARESHARACAVIDPELASITPEWIDLLLRPVIYAGYDFVTPYYHRHKYDGTLTSSIVGPLSRALYGARLRQPIGGDVALSSRLLSRYLERGDWDTDVVRHAPGVWMTTIAVAEGYKVCQSFLGPRPLNAHYTRPGLSSMLQQIVGAVFLLMEEYQWAWTRGLGSTPVDLFGFRLDAGLDPVRVDLQPMLDTFRRGCRDLTAIWELALPREALRAVLSLGYSLQDGRGAFHFPDELWARIIADFACAHHARPFERGHLLRSLVPLYLARVASFVIETENLFAKEVEQRIERLCLSFEQTKPYLISRWRNQRPTVPSALPTVESPAPLQPAGLEVRT